MIDYPFTVKPLTEEDGGGFSIEYPDLPGCIADGETIEEAITAGKEAIEAWIETANALGRNIPQPGGESLLFLTDYSGKYVQRLPKSLHAALSSRAKSEGVSINTLALSYIAQGIGFNEEGGEPNS